MYGCARPSEALSCLRQEFPGARQTFGETPQQVHLRVMWRAAQGMCCIIEIEAKIWGSPKQQQLQKVIIFLGKLCSEVKNRFQVTLFLPCLSLCFALWHCRHQLGPHHSDVFNVSGGTWDSWWEGWQMAEHRPVMQ